VTDQPELIASHLVSRQQHAGEQPTAWFTEQNVSFMLWHDAWWMQFHGYWYRVHGDDLIAALQRLWVHIHSLRAPSSPAAKPPTVRSARRIETIESL
jgi:hypothetical protein